MMLSKASRSLVACNIYVSAGGNPKHRDMLLRLLGETQELCRLANKNETENKSGRRSATLLEQKQQRVVVVHAFRDGPYDRSSFHLAGSPNLVADVGSYLAMRAVQTLMVETETTSHSDDDSQPAPKEPQETKGKRHPTVGFVDHVSVLPLEENNGENKNKNTNNQKQEDSASTTGSVARDIGESLRSSGADVLYYGHAHPSGTELATVRRDSTRFFDDTNASTNGDTAAPKSPTGQATVGAPQKFVENYNIRLKPNISRKIARTLTEFVRERSGRGLPFVEALTLAYGPDQYEVACNLLDPAASSSKDIDERLRIWEEEQQQQRGGDDAKETLIETAYRVGTTTDMCLEALREVSTEEGETAHNKIVFQRLEDYF